MSFLARALVVLLLAVPVLRAESFNEDETGATTDASPAAADKDAAAAAPEAPDTASQERTAADDATPAVVPEDVAPAEATAPAPAEAVAAETVAPAEAAVSEPAAEVAGGETHRVAKGDTLWGLAGAYMKDPFQWPKIWEANRGVIQDPNLIFPDQEVVIPSVAAAEAMAEAPTESAAPPDTAAAEAAAAETVAPAEAAAEAPAEAIAPEAETATEDMDVAANQPKTIKPVENPVDTQTAIKETLSKARSAGAGFMGGQADTFVADENWEYDGYILRDREQKNMISQGDVVYLNVGAAAGVKPRMMAYVYRIGKKIRDPFLKKYSGKVVKRVGTVVITGNVGDEGCTAVVTNSLEAIQVGDIVKFVAVR